MTAITTAQRTAFEHPVVSRRAAIQAGAIGLLGLGMNHLAALTAAEPRSANPLSDRSQAPQQPSSNVAPTPSAKAVIYIFLSGGLSQLDSFDLKPAAPDAVRGEFRPIATRTSGIEICEHLPRLAERSNRWAVCRSLTHPYNEHSQGHMAMLSGRTAMPTGFDPNKPRSSDWPSIAAVAGYATAGHATAGHVAAASRTQARNNLPPAVVLPERLVHNTGRVIPGQFAGEMGPVRDPWFIEACRYNPKSYGAIPEYGFHHERGQENPDHYLFQAPSLTLPEGLTPQRFAGRMGLLAHIECQRRRLERSAEVEQFDRFRQGAISLLADGRTQQALDVTRADPREQDRYGRNVFGWSLLMARRLVEAGVRLVQVNLGNNETWDTHQSAFGNLRDFLFPPTDRAVSALLDDLHDRGLLASTLVVMAGEFGRTPKVFSLPGGKLPGRDHWGAAQSVFFAGGGVRGGTVVGRTDNTGGHPADAPQTPENMAATIYHALGIPRNDAWKDAAGRPHFIYHGEPIAGLT